MAYPLPVLGLHLNLEHHTVEQSPRMPFQVSGAMLEMTKLKLVYDDSLLIWTTFPFLIKKDYSKKYKWIGFYDKKIFLLLLFLGLY